LLLAFSFQVDGTGLVALREIWAVDKLGFLKYAQVRDSEKTGRQRLG
jgi:hypothetical protein